MDGMLMSFKGLVDTKSHIFSPLWQVARRNRFCSEPMQLSPEGVFTFSGRQPVHPAFGLRFDVEDGTENDDLESYESDDDFEADSEELDSDEDTA